MTKGLNKQIEAYNKSKKEHPFQHLLIKTFIKQIDTNVKVIIHATNKFYIEFQKSDTVKGTSTSLTKKEDGFSRSIVA